MQYTRAHYNFRFDGRMVRRYTVISPEQLGFKSNPAANFGTGDVSRRSNLCLTVSSTSLVSACTASMLACRASIEFLVSAWTTPMSACMASIEFLVSACIAPIFTAEPGREMRDKGVVLTSTIERCLSDTTYDRPDVDSVITVYYNAKLAVNKNNYKRQSNFISYYAI